VTLLGIPEAENVVNFINYSLNCNACYKRLEQKTSCEADSHSAGKEIPLFMETEGSSPYS
jgi:hypothetical protein